MEFDRLCPFVLLFFLTFIVQQRQNFESEFEHGGESPQHKSTTCPQRNISLLVGLSCAEGSLKSTMLRRTCCGWRRFYISKIWKTCCHYRQHWRYFCFRWTSSVVLYRLSCSCIQSSRRPYWTATLKKTIDCFDTTISLKKNLPNQIIIWLTSCAGCDEMRFFPHLFGKFFPETL